jgi:hypothetical protein
MALCHRAVRRRAAELGIAATPSTTKSKTPLLFLRPTVIATWRTVARFGLPAGRNGRLRRGPIITPIAVSVQV